MRQLRDRGDVGEPQDWIAWRLDMDEPRLRPQRRFDGGDVRRVDRRGLNAELGQNVMSEFGDAGVADVRQHQMIAGFKLGKPQSSRRGHAAGEDDRRFAALQSGEPLFEQVVGRVVPARVDERRRAVERVGGKPAVGGGIEAGRQHQRIENGLLRGARLGARMNRLGRLALRHVSGQRSFSFGAVMPNWPTFGRCPPFPERRQPNWSHLAKRERRYVTRVWPARRGFRPSSP